MLSEKIVRNIRGYFTVSVYDSFDEGTLNDCAAIDISVWNVRRNNSALLFCVAAKDKKRFEKCMQKNRAVYEIITEKGAVHTLKKYKRRYALLLGGVLAAVFMFFMSSFIWSIEINGNVNLTDEEILEVLEEFGFSEGTIKKDIDYYILYQKIILKKPEIAWLAINIKGTHAEIEVLERALPPIIDDKETVSNIVASADGVIEDMQVYAGTPLVKRGDAVKKGDVLVSAVVESLDGSVKYVAAKAVIKAKTAYTLRYVCPDKVTNLYETGKEINRYKLKIFNFSLNLAFNSRIPMARYDKITKDNQLCIGKGYYLPIHLICDTYKELTPVESELDYTAQLEMSKLALEESLKELLPYAEITSKEFSCNQTAAGLEVLLDIECIEDIGVRIFVSEE